MTSPLESAVVAELAAVADALQAADIEFVVGGSALLVLSGIDVPVGDIDLYTDHADPQEVVAALSGWKCRVRPGGPEPWASSWVLAADRGGGVSLDMIGQLAVMIDGRMARFEVASSQLAVVSGRSIPLAPLAQWYHLYRIHNRSKADKIAAVVGPAERLAAAVELGIAVPE